MCGVGFAICPAGFAIFCVGRAAAKLRFNASIRLTTFCADRAGAKLLVGFCACFSRSFSMYALCAADRTIH